MENIGLKYLICAPVTETETSVTYADGLVMSYAISVDLSVEVNEASLYRDDKIIENIKEFKSGTLSLNGDHLRYEVLAVILSHTVEGITEGGGQKLTAKGDDDGAYVGVGFYPTTIKDSKRKYRAIWLHKVKFSVPNESLETKGDSITFQTPTIEGTILPDILSVWKEEGLFTTEAAAKEWLNTLAGIGEVTP